MSLRRFAVTAVLALAACRAAAAEYGGSDPAFLRPDGTFGSFGVGLGGTGLFILDVDADGTPEILAGTASAWAVFGRDAHGYLVPLHFHASPDLGVSYPSVDPIVAIRPGRFDGGALQVAVLHQSGLLEFYDATHGGLLSTQQAAAYANAMAAGALGGGPDRLAIVTASALAVYAKGQEGALWTTPGAGGTDVAVGNVDDDPALEVVVAQGGTAPGVVVDGATHAVQWSPALGFGDHVAVGDLDGDGRDEIASYRRYEVDVWDAEAKSLKWSAPGEYYDWAIGIADTDGDGAPEVIAGSAYTTMVLEGVTGAKRDSFYIYGTSAVTAGDVSGDCAFRVVIAADLLSSYDSDTHAITELVNPQNPGGTFAVGAVDGAGATRVLRSVQGRVTLLDLASPRVIWTRSVSSPYGGAPPVALLKVGAGPLLYAVDGRQFSTELTAYDGASGAVVWTQSFTASALASGDVNNDGISELLAASGSSVFLLDGRTGAVLWTSPSLTGNVLAVALASTNLVPGAEILAAVADEGLFAFDGYTHALKWFRSTPKISAFDVGDVDGDGAPDVLVATSDGNLSAYDGISQALLFSASVGSAVSAVRVGDLDGDGAREIAVVVRNGAGGALRILKASDRSVIWDSGELPSSDKGNALLIADADDDGRPEVMLGTDVVLELFEHPGPPETAPPVFDGPAGVAAAAPLGCCPTLELGWNAARDAASPPVTYRVYRRDSAGFAPGPDTLVAETPFTLWRDRDLPRGVTFHYVVRAVDRLGNEDANTHELAATVATGAVITQPPVRSETCLQSSASFTAAAVGAPPLAYQWLKNGVALAGRTSATLTIASVSAADEGIYSVRVTESGASCPVESRGVALEIVVKPGDVNRDCKVDTADVFALINALFAGGPAPLGDPDVNGDDVFDVGDVFFLINFLFGGGPPPVASRG